MKPNALIRSIILLFLTSSLVSATTRHAPGVQYPKIQDAIDASAPGDIVVIAPGTHIIHNASIGYATYLYVNKDITITSENIDNPAATTIQGGIQIGYYIPLNTYSTANPTIMGLTIQGIYYAGRDGCQGGSTSAPCDFNYPTSDGRTYSGDNTSGWNFRNKWKVGDPNGQDGYSIQGGGIVSWGSSSPKVTNCVFNGCSITASNGGDSTGDGWGGWAGWAYGGAVYIGLGGKPIFKNCDFIDCNAVGGDGGNASNGRGGSWGSSNEPMGMPHLGTGWRWAPHTGYGEIWRYSGLGGAVYCDEDSAPVFDNCNFANNRAVGGSCGISDPEVFSWPHEHWKIARHGGAVFCAAGSAPDFNDCIFVDNLPDPNNGVGRHKNGPGVADNPYIGFGGAIAYENGATPKFTNCIFNGNSADAGGAAYGESAGAQYQTCTIMNNSALVGGGICMVDGDDIISESQITGNRATISGAAGGGLYILGGNVQVVDSTLSNNTASSSGGGVYIDSSINTLLRNCLITGNQAGRDGAGVSSNWDSSTDIDNCTIAGNTVTDTNGLGGGVRAGYTGTLSILNSILWDNSAAHGDQVAIGVNGMPADVYVNYSDIQGGTTAVYYDPGVSPSHLHWDYVHNLTGLAASDPLFVSGYYLSQPPDQIVTSPCVDSGYLLADNNSLHMYRHTTSTDGKLDNGTVDMGYHYVRTADIAEDYDISGAVDNVDWALFVKWWESTGCSFPYWCDGRDLNQDGTVDEFDEALFLSNWLFQETTPPNPDPMTWDVAPYYVSSQVKMVATAAFDNSTGRSVEYYFQRTNDVGIEQPGSFRDWSPDPCYTDTTVASATTYGYKVKARDTSTNHNETGFSLIAFVNTSAGITPTPATQTWATVPYAVSSTQIGMAATTATAGTAGVEYYFDCVAGAGHDSGWQAGTTYIDSNLAPSTSYSYRVRARNMISPANMNNWSTTLAATTLASGGADVNAPTPNPMTWATPPQTISQSSITMVATTATDVSGVEYYFACVSGGGHDSGWQTSTTYTDTGLTGTSYSYQVRARDASPAHNTTAWSDVATATIDRSPPTPNPLTWTSLPTQTFGGGQYTHSMACVTATDVTGPVQYKFICLDNSGVSSGWQAGTSYSVGVGTFSCRYRWQVVARDGLGNQTSADPTTVYVFIP
jgi:parallel beta-helix repeat protein